MKLTELQKILKKGNILFLENDRDLYHSVANFEKWLIDSKMKYNALFQIDELPLEYIKQQIEWYDVFIFETTWTGERSRELKELISKYTYTKKTVIECYCHEPTWYKKPKGIIHDLITVECSDEDDLERTSWEIKKLR